MYFPGLKWSAPISTFQIPLRAVGLAPIRYDQIRNLSDRLFKEGKPFWGLRTLLWSIHFMQDLHQPFHTTQILDLRFIPIRTLFSGLVARTTQSVANYHYAYEGLMLEYVKEGTSDPHLTAIIEDIELRVAVELAKLEMAHASRSEI